MGCTQVTCPITDVPTLFIDPNDNGKWVAAVYLELANRYQISFREIFRMKMVVKYGPEAWEPGFDDLKVKRILRDFCFDAELNRELMNKFKLPLAELIRVWLDTHEALSRAAHWHPGRRKEIEEFLAERERVMLALLERAERQANGEVASLKS